MLAINIVKEYLEGMPTIKIAKQRFNKLMGEEFTLGKLEDLGFEYGIEV